MTKETYIRLDEMLSIMEEVVHYIRNCSEEEYLRSVVEIEKNLSYTVEAVNMELLDSPKVLFFSLDVSEAENAGAEHRKRTIEQYTRWLDEIKVILERQYQAENIWDERFIRLMDRVRYVNVDMIIEKVKESLFAQGAEMIDKLCIYYQTYHEMWGTLDVANGRYDVILNRVTALKEHKGDFIWLYDQLGDQRSRLVLVSMLYNWVTFDLAYIRGMKEANYTDYFDLDLVNCDGEEVVVDLGAWIGDSALNYIQTYGKYKRIYCYEIDETSMEELQENLSGYPDIEFRNKGAGDKNSIGYIDGEPTSSCNKIIEDDKGRAIEMVKLDDDIKEKVTLIKMDIEGGEQKALLGCTRHIREEKPKLLICVYHNNEDIWKIPRMIMNMTPGYQFYLRSNGAQWGPAEIVLLAIHREE